ncbi:hypothetical protein M413DRAFT_159354 [Hebeloma cylindrosporum]|uniref:Uncharacterized protein n=1 Tax=Hebeloma cylindrosporum TaxID=76867 RepID=A0A0C3BX46_HEBCY|nr:hypothetical protein M413DRAFT_159354 [Hebeloma cylindrosporum h7]
MTENKTNYRVQEANLPSTHLHLPNISRCLGLVSAFEVPTIRWKTSMLFTLFIRYPVTLDPGTQFPRYPRPIYPRPRYPISQIPSTHLPSTPATLNMAGAHERTGSNAFYPDANPSRHQMMMKLPCPSPNHPGTLDPSYTRNGRRPRTNKRTNE